MQTKLSLQETYFIANSFRMIQYFFQDLCVRYLRAALLFRNNMNLTSSHYEQLREFIKQSFRASNMSDNVHTESGVK